MAVIVNGVTLENIIVIDSLTGNTIPLDLFQDSDGNVLWEKLPEGTIGLVFSGIDANGQTEYSPTTVDNSTTYIQNPNYNGTPVSYYLGYLRNIFDLYSNQGSANDLRGVDQSFDRQLETITIPSTYNGLPVLDIGNFGLSIADNSNDNFSMPNLSKVVVQEGIKNIYIKGLVFTPYKDFELVLPESLEFADNTSDADYDMDSIGIRAFPSAWIGTPPTAPVNITVTLKSKNVNLAVSTHSKGDGSNAIAVISYIEDGDGNKIYGTRTMVFETSVETFPKLCSGSYIGAVEHNSNTFDYYIIKGNRITPLTFQNRCMPGLLANYCYLVCEEKNPNMIILPLAGSDTGIAYYKSAYTGTMYAENQTLYDYDWGTDNLTPTFYKLDRTTLVERLSQPTISLSGSVLTITPPQNATRFQIINGTNQVIATTTSTTIDLAYYTTAGTSYTLTVRALADGYVSSIKSSSVSYSA